MKALVIYPKNNNEIKFIANLFKKLAVGSSSLTQEELEDIDLSKMPGSVDKTKKVSRSEIMKKLTA